MSHVVSLHPLLEKVNKGFIFGPFTSRVFFWAGVGGWCLRACGTCQISLGTHFTIQCLWIQTNMEPGSSVGAVRSSRVLLGQELRPAVLVIKDGKIHQIQPHATDVACEVTNKAKLTRQKSELDQAFQTLSLSCMHNHQRLCVCAGRCWMWATAW